MAGKSHSYWRLDTHRNTELECRTTPDHILVPPARTVRGRPRPITRAQVEHQDLGLHKQDHFPLVSNLHVHVPQMTKRRRKKVVSHKWNTLLRSLQPGQCHEAPVSCRHLSFWNYNVNDLVVRTDLSSLTRCPITLAQAMLTRDLHMPNRLLFERFSRFHLRRLAKQNCRIACIYVDTYVCL